MSKTFAAEKVVLIVFVLACFVLFCGSSYAQVTRDVTLVYRVSDDFPPLQSCSLWINNTGWHKDQTKTVVPGGYNSFVVTVGSGVYRWTVECLDTGGHDVYATNTGAKGYWIFVYQGSTTTTTTTTTTSSTNHPPTTTTSSTTTTTHPPTTTTTHPPTTTTTPPAALCTLASVNVRCDTSSNCMLGHCTYHACCSGSGDCGLQTGTSQNYVAWCCPNGGHACITSYLNTCSGGTWNVVLPQTLGSKCGGTYANAP